MKALHIATTAYKIFEKTTEITTSVHDVKMVDSNSTEINIEVNFNNSSVAFMSFMGIISNVLLLVAYIKNPLKCFRNSGTYLLMNLSVSDLATCIFAPFYFEFIEIINLSYFFGFLAQSSGNASILSIVFISFDRFLLVVYPLKHRHFIKGRNVVICVFAIWLMASILPILRMLDSELALTGQICSAAILVMLSAALYAITYSKLKEHSKSIASQNSTENRAQERRIQKDKQFLKTIILIACIALVCIVPSMLYFLLNRSLGFSQNNLTHKIFYEVSRVILYTNFVINPWIYILRLPIYRKTFYLIYCKGRLR